MTEYNPIEEFTVGEGDDELNENDREVFKPAQGESYRISLAWWQDIEAQERLLFNMNADRPRLLKAKVGFMEGAGYVLFKPGFEKYSKYISSDEKEFSDRIATVIVSWPVFRKGGKAGQTDPDLFGAGRYEVLPWVFSKFKWQQMLRQHNKGKTFGRCDLSVHCTNGKFQHLEIGSYDNNYLRDIMLKKPPLFESIREKVERAAKRCRGLLGTSYSESDLRAKLGLTEGDSDPVIDDISVGDEDYNDLLTGIVNK